MGEIQYVKDFFASRQLCLAEEWLESCISWIKEERLLPEGYALKELQLKVYEQWLMLDLRDVEAPCLPPNLSDKIKLELTGNYSLQMMQILDISKPNLWQYTRIKNRRTNDPDKEEFGKRVLMLTLTDGVQEVKAIEHKPIKTLSFSLSPGVKIRIIGPVMMRRGRILLEEKNVQVLGGEVEEMQVEFALENVLARALNLLENPNPEKFDVKLLEVEEKENVQNWSSYKPSIVPLRDQKNNSKNTTKIEAVKRQSLDLPVNVPPKRRSPTPDLFDDGFDETQFNNIAMEVEELNCKEPKPEETQIKDIKEVVKLHQESKEGTYKIHAKFESIVEKLSFSDEEYQLVIQIKDSSGTITTQLASELIAELAGYSPKEIMALKKSILDKDQSATNKVINAIRNVKDGLVLLDRPVEIMVKSSMQLPVITKF